MRFPVWKDSWRDEEQGCMSYIPVHWCQGDRMTGEGQEFRRRQGAHSLLCSAQAHGRRPRRTGRFLHLPSTAKVYNCIMNSMEACMEKACSVRTRHPPWRSFVGSWTLDTNKGSKQHDRSAGDGVGVVWRVWSGRDLRRDGLLQMPRARRLRRILMDQKEGAVDFETCHNPLLVLVCKPCVESRMPIWSLCLWSILNEGPSGLRHASGVEPLFRDMGSWYRHKA